MFPIKNVRSLDLLDVTPESPQEHCHKYSRTLMLQQEQEIARCTTVQLEMKPDSPALAPELSHVHIIHDKCIDFLYQTPESP